MTMFSNLAKATYAAHRLNEGGYEEYTTNKTGSILNYFERAKTDPANLNIHTRRSCRAAAPVLNNIKQIPHFVPHCLEPKSDRVKMTEIKMSDAKSEFSELFNSLKTAEELVWSEGNTPITNALSDELGFTVINTKNHPDEAREEGALLFASQMKSPCSYEYSDLKKFDDDEYAKELVLEFENALINVEVSGVSLATRRIPFKSMETILEELRPEQVNDLSTFGTKKHCEALILQMGQFKEAWLKEVVEKQGEILLPNYTTNRHWDLTMALSYAFESPLASISYQDDRIEDFHMAYDTIVKYEQTILRNLHPAHLAFLEAINPEAVSTDNENLHAGRMEGLVSFMAYETQKFLNEVRAAIPNATGKEVLELREITKNVLQKDPREIFITSLVVLGQRHHGLDVYVRYRLETFHALITHSLKALIVLATETLLNTHDEMIVRNTQAAKKPVYKKVTGKQAKAKKQHGLEPREIVTSPNLTIVDYRVTGLERRRKSDASLHKDNTGTRRTHSKARHIVREHFAMLKPRVLKDGTFRPARPIYKPTHWRGTLLTAKARKIK